MTNHRTYDKKLKFLLGTSMIALATSFALGAQAAEQTAQTRAVEPTEEITVTGSRIALTGAEAPTPVTVISSEYLEQRGAVNVADMLNEMPSFRASTAPAQGASQLAGAGGNSPDLRSLGANRTLALIDGKRVIPVNASGRGDLNSVPSIFIERADVVTGGASASYGSDAIAGVVNLILKENFVGYQADISGGVSTYGDNLGGRAALLAGWNIGERLHTAIAFEYDYSEGIGDMYNRPWGREEWGLATNPTPGNGAPNLIRAPNVHNSTMTPTGLITSGPLKGTTFTADGAPIPCTYGQYVGTSLMVGGNCGVGHNNFYAGFPLLPKITRRVVYSKSNFAITDSTDIYANLQFSNNDMLPRSAHAFNAGNLTIFSGNPFIPATIQQQMTAQGISSFSFGRFHTDHGLSNDYNDATTVGAAVGIKGDIGTWTYDIYNDYGRHLLKFDYVNQLMTGAFANSIDTVVNPANGQIVCRVTLTTPNSGCLPFNPFGLNRNDPEVINSFIANNYVRERYIQNVTSVNVQGPLFDVPAGEVRAAFGAEYKRNSTHITTNPNSQAGRFWFYNRLPFDGKQSVKEVYGEVQAPILKNTPGAQSLELNGAVRYTDYQLVGSVVTWKVGAQWQPIDEIRVRATRSRDIRAPNVNELFAPRSLPSAFLEIIDPFTNQQYRVTPVSGGNPAVKSEKSNTTTVGVVVTPVRGLSLTADYWSIDLRGAIGSLSSQDVINGCFRGNTGLCPLISRGSNGLILGVDASTNNIGTIKESGLDLAANYSLNLEDFSAIPGSLTFNAQGTKTFKYRWFTGLATYELVGQASSVSNQLPMAPKWVANGSISYSLDRFTGNIGAKFLSAGTYDNRYVEGAAVPGSTTITINDNSVPSRIYFNMGLTYDIVQTDDGGRVQVYAVTNNLFNKAPPMIPDTTRGVTNYTYYDVIGRFFRAGMRFKF